MRADSSAKFSDNQKLLLVLGSALFIMIVGIIVYQRTIDHPESEIAAPLVSETAAPPTSSNDAKESRPVVQADQAQERPAPSPVAESPPLPKSERSFCDAVTKYSALCVQSEESGANAMKLESIRTDVTRALRKAAGERGATLKGWIGTVSSVGTTEDGRGALDVKLPCGTILSTSSSDDANSMADYGPIESNSKLFKIAGELTTGEDIRFSGEFVSDWGFAFNELSTDSKCHADGETLLFKFSDISH